MHKEVPIDVPIIQFPGIQLLPLMLLAPQVYNKPVVPGIGLGSEAVRAAGELADRGPGFGGEGRGVDGGMGWHVGAGGGPGGFVGGGDAKAGEDIGGELGGRFGREAGREVDVAMR